MKEIIIGIDLGTTNSEVAALIDGKIQVIESDGEEILPSYVGLNPEGELLVGVPARNQYVLYPERTVKSIKRKMGRSEKIKLGESEFSPQEISAIILKTLKERAEKALNCKVKKSIITVPAQFSDAQRQATREAGDLAGLDVIRIINEPTAASLAYDADDEEGKLMLIYDLGGGTFDVSIVSVQDGVIEVLSSHGDNHLGGDDFDDKIVKMLVDTFRKEHKIDLSKDRIAMNRLLHAAEDAKKILSFKPFVNIREDNIAEKKGVPLHIDIEFSREQFNTLIADFLEKTLDAVHEAIKDAEVSPSGFSDVLLVGGSTRIPAVVDLLRDVTGLIPRQDINPDLCVSLGAGVLSSREMGAENQKILVDVTPYTFGIESVLNIGGSPHYDHFAPVIFRNSPLPLSKSDVFYTMHDYQKRVDIKIYQGENSNSKMNTYIGEFIIEGLSKVPEGNEIIVKMDLDLDGILHVSATEKCTGVSKKITINDSFAKMDSEEKAKSQTKIKKLFGDGDAEIIDIKTDKFESESKEPNCKAGKLIKKTEEYLDKMHPEDRAESEKLIIDIRKAIAINDTEKIDEFLENLADLLFFIDE
jgi:molecular chaperone DnaK